MSLRQDTESSGGLLGHQRARRTPHTHHPQDSFRVGQYRRMLRVRPERRCLARKSRRRIARRRPKGTNRSSASRLPHLQLTMKLVGREILHRRGFLRECGREQYDPLPSRRIDGPPGDWMRPGTRRGRVSIPALRALRSGRGSPSRRAHPGWEVGPHRRDPTGAGREAHLRCRCSSSVLGETVSTPAGSSGAGSRQGRNGLRPNQAQSPPPSGRDTSE